MKKTQRKKYFVREFLSKLNFLLTRRDKQFLAGLFALSIFVALVETVGISAIMPFISVATNPGLVESNDYYRAAYGLLGFETVSGFIIFFGFVLIGFYVFRGGLNLFYTWLLARFSYGRYHLLAYRLFSGYLALPYEEFTKRNSAKLNKTIVTEANNLTQLIHHMLFLLSEIATTLLLYGLLLWVNWKITLVLTLLLGVKTFLLLKTISPAISRQGKKRIERQTGFYETVNDSLGNFKLIKLLGNEKSLINRFGES
ncbi:MAG: ABC transporter transmembrane domain-containing protein, partial [Campylobacterales bacterium]